MSRKFARVSGFRVVLASMTISMTILTGTMVYAQQTPVQETPPVPPPATQQQPNNPASSTQEASTEEIGPVRKPKPKDYKNWTFNVGGGGSLTNGATGNFVRGGGGIAAVGVARNYSKNFGFRLDFQFDNLPLRTSAVEQAQALSATSQVYSFILDPIINIPVTKVWSGYIVAGAGFFYRSGKLTSSTAIAGSACNPFFIWWGNCFNSSLPLNRNFISTSQDEWGENFGGGIARKVTPKIEIYGEFRYLHGTHSGVTTDLRPITVGVRW